MIFTELRFFLFFVLVFVVYWALGWNTARKVWLLACSYAFYAAWDWRFLPLIIGSTLVDFVAGLMIARSGTPRARRVWLWVSLAANLGVLGLFKYFDFFARSLADLAHRLGAEVSAPSLHLILPLGISFYTFEKLSYTIDIYRGTLTPTRRPIDLALFVAFFPRLIAGPIMRAADLLPQFETRRAFSTVNLRSCLLLFLIGYFKKACISDTVGPVVDLYFAQPAAYTALSGITAVVLYAVQIYCDFSGYTDMARACAGLLGYNFSENFRWPYLSANITEFWRRWHITLSSWLRDYLYIPLGGSRGSKAFTYRNLMLTMLLGGLWHGAAWTFVVWGGLHSLALVIHKEWSRWSTRITLPPALGVLGPLAGTLLTFYFVCLCWIFFRSADLNTALSTARAWMLFRGQGSEALSPRYLWLFALLATLHITARGDRLVSWTARLPDWAFAAALGVATALALALTPPGTRPFIYFQF